MEHSRYNGGDGDWLDLVRQRIDLRHSSCGLNLATLRVHSMRQEYHESLLQDFYENLMIPAFPIREERIDIEDWIDSLSGQRNPESAECESEAPTAMDVLLLLCDSTDSKSSRDQQLPAFIVLAGIVVDYFRLAQVGLVSYIVVHPSYRQCGIMSLFHAHEAISCLREIHQEHLEYRQRLDSEQASDIGSLDFAHVPWSPDIRAIFCEVNTVEAGDVSVQELAHRHATLQKLGYRLLDFPYMQPPLTISYEKEDETASDAAVVPVEPFSPIMLLIYWPEPTTINSPHGDSSAVACEIDSSIVCDYVMEFFLWTCDCESLKETIRCHGDEYYQLIQWYRHHHPTTTIVRGRAEDGAASGHHQSSGAALEDPKIHWIPMYRKFVQSCNVVAIVGAGASGLAAAVSLAEKTLTGNHRDERENLASCAAFRPTHIFILEADSTVGGRIRTIETEPNTSRTDASLWETDRDRYAQFAPWTIPLGAEFVHGINSEINRIAASQGWELEPTFDLSQMPPGEADNRCRRRVKIFGNDRLWDLHAAMSKEDGESGLFSRSMQTARSLWERLCNIAEGLDGRDSRISSIPDDMSLGAYVESQMVGSSTQQVTLVKNILDAMFAATHASTIDHYGVNEASREECNWDYTESNWRTKLCFLEVIDHYLSRIDSVNEQYDKGLGLTKIHLIRNCPISCIRNIGNEPTQKWIELLGRNVSHVFHCDKVIVTVPLGVLKSSALTFEQECRLPPEKAQAIAKVNMLGGVKAHALLRKGTDIDVLSQVTEQNDLIFCPGETFPQLWFRRNYESVLVTGFGSNVISSDQQHHMNCLMKQLRRVMVDDNGQSIFLDPASPSCSAFAAHDWSTVEFVKGLYSSPSVNAGWRRQPAGESETVTTCREELARPIFINRVACIFFAGEHTNSKCSATVQAAMESGIRAAAQAWACVGRTKVTTLNDAT
jgi:Flavin containing amine oxidoreductase